jgi:hypothetical protein
MPDANQPRNDRSRIIERPREPILKLRGLMIGLALGVAIGLALVVAVMVLFFRASAPVVTRQTLAEARRRWAEHGPHSYVVDLALRGSQSGAIHVEVRNGVVVDMTREGRRPKQRRTWDYWSVPNQFATIAQDLESAQAPQQAFGVSSPAQVLLRAEFDARYGYPAFYQRTVMGGSSQVEWRVTRFVPLP